MCDVEKNIVCNILMGNVTVLLFVLVMIYKIIDFTYISLCSFLNMASMLSLIRLIQ